VHRDAKHAAAFAQNPAQELRAIGTIHNIQSENSEAFVQGLREAGLVDGQNIVLEARFYGGLGSPLDRYDEYARELVALKCSVIFASNPYAIRVVLKATSDRRAITTRGNEKTAYSRYMYCWVRRSRHYRASTLGIAPSK
jgi:hypothetical protein